MKQYIVPMNSTTIFVASERQEWTKEEEEREENREEQQGECALYSITFFSFFFLLPVPFSICAICINFFLY